MSMHHMHAISSFRLTGGSRNRTPIELVIGLQLADKQWRPGRFADKAPRTEGWLLHHLKIRRGKHSGGQDDGVVIDANRAPRQPIQGTNCQHSWTMSGPCFCDPRWEYGRTGSATVLLVIVQGVAETIQIGHATSMLLAPQFVPLALEQSSRLCQLVLRYQYWLLLK